MSDLALRTAAAGLALAGLATLLAGGLAAAAAGGLAQLPLHLQTIALGAVLLAASALSVLRLPVLAVGLLTKLGFVAAWVVLGAPWDSWQPLLEVASLVLMSASGAIFLREARRQARWDGAACLNLES